MWTVVRVPLPQKVPCAPVRLPEMLQSNLPFLPVLGFPLENKSLIVLSRIGAPLALSSKSLRDELWEVAKHYANQGSTD
jgi:hypothetical protein